MGLGLRVLRNLGLRTWVLGQGFGFWAGFLGLALKVLGFGLRFFGGWAWGLGFG